MHKQPWGYMEGYSGHVTGWLDWLGRHPGLVLLGTLAVAYLAFYESPKPEQAACDASGEEAPLFI